jgi:hypothetical protein
MQPIEGLMAATQKGGVEPQKGRGIVAGDD